MKQSAQSTKDRLKESLSNATHSTKERMKNELSQRMPRLSQLPTLKPKETISYAKESITQSTSRATDAAAKVLTETTTQVASNVTTQVQEGVHKASRWLWWWGLAAVGVYGMSTTLTKEGVATLKEMITSSPASRKEDRDDGSSGGSWAASTVNASSAGNSVDERASSNSWMSSIRGAFARRNNNSGEDS
jgi:hypothetical protein